MHKVLAILRNFIVANVCLALPAIWLLGNGSPERLDIYVTTPKQIILRTGTIDVNRTVSFDRSNVCNSGNERQRLRLYFGDGCDVTKLAMGFCNGPTSFILSETSVITRGIFKRVLDVRNIAEAYDFVGDIAHERMEDGTVKLTIGSSECCLKPKQNVADFWHLSVGSDYRLVRLIMMGEFLLLLLSVCALGIRISSDRKRNLLASASVAAIASFFVVVVLPLQSYLVNASMFPFDLTELLMASVFKCLLFSVVLCALLFAAQCSFGFLPHVVLLGVLVYEYLETGIFANDLPSLNGDVDFFHIPSRAQRDTLFLIAILSVFGVGYHWLKKYIHYFALAFFVMSLASLADVRRERSVDKSDSAYELISKFDVANSAVYSSSNNVFIFTLDSLASGCVAEIIRDTPEFSDTLSGFVQYRNNVAMSTCTALSVPGIMTGKYSSLNTTAEDYAFSIFKEGSLPVEYAKDGIATYFCSGLSNNGFTTHRTSYTGVITNDVGSSVYARRTNERPGFSLFEIVRFRMTPFTLKGWILYMTMAGLTAFTDVVSEVVLYSILAGAPVSDTMPFSFHSYHTYGTHPPIAFDRDGNALTVPNDTYEGMYGQTYCVLSHLLNLFKKLKEKGVYDRSTIIVCSDHGCCLDHRPEGDMHGLPVEARSFMWVKPYGAKSKLTTSDMPTGQSRIYPLVMALKEKILTQGEIERILYLDKRLVRFTNWKDHEISEWNVSSDWVVEKTTGACH